MTLIITVLEQELEQAYLKNVPHATTDQRAQITQMATDISNAIDAYIRSATVISEGTVASAIPVQVVPATGTGATTSTGIVSVTGVLT
jgi:hypothetical protein